MVTRARAGIFKPKAFNANIRRPTEPDSIAAALTSPQWKQAMKEKYNALIKNNTWILVPFNSHMNVVDNKWVVRLKYKPDVTIQIYKARLVVKGFQQTLLLVLYNWHIQQLDVNNAFLNIYIYIYHEGSWV